jgi:hypothetical protein
VFLDSTTQTKTPGLTVTQKIFYLNKKFEAPLRALVQNTKALVPTPLLLKNKGVGVNTLKNRGEIVFILE